MPHEILFQGRKDSVTKVSTVYRVGSLHLSEGVIFNFYGKKTPHLQQFRGPDMKKDNQPTAGVWHKQEVCS